MNIPPELVVISLILIGLIYYNSRKKVRSFKIYKHHIKGYKAVKVGIAWLASIFMPIWFLFRGMWSIFFTYIILIFIAVAIDEAIYGHISSIDFNNASNGEWVWAGIQFIVFILPLFKGNDWTAKHLVKKGYLLVETVDAISKENAIAIALENATSSSYSEDDIQNKSSSNHKKTTESKHSLSQSFSGLGLRNEVYSDTLNLCLRKIREKADEMNINLNDYYNTSNANSFQEESILFFLASAAITAHNKKHNMLKMGVRDQKALNKILNEFLRNNGIRGMDLISSMEPLTKDSVIQGAYGKDYVFAYKHNINNPDEIMTNFVQSLVTEIPYGNKFNKII